MRTERDVEAYLSASGRRFDAVDSGEATYLVSLGQGVPLMLRVDAPLLIARVHIGPLPSGDASPLLRQLLVHNARDLVHINYGLEDEQVVLSSALSLENLDRNELEAVLDEFELSLSRDVPQLLSLRGAHAATV